MAKRAVAVRAAMVVDVGAPSMAMDEEVQSVVLRGAVVIKVVIKAVAIRAER